MIEWLMTEPHPWKRAHVHGADQGRIGWRWHAVPDNEPHKYRAALCGLRPAHGWGGDLFADEMCEKCRKIAVRRALPMPEGLQRAQVIVYREQMGAKP